MDKSKIYGLLGRTLAHSFSRSYFGEKFAKEALHDHDYLNFELEDIVQFKELIEDKKELLQGLNVTIPYKEAVIPYLDELDPVAASMAAVNTIKFMPDGKLKGFNTDVIGFRDSLIDFYSGALDQANCLVLGTGGASKAVAYVLEALGADYQFVSRRKGDQQLTYAELDKTLFQSVDLIINTTPLGTFPNVEECPDLPYEYLTQSQHLYDLVYNPKLTKFLKFGQEKGCSVKNGLEMLEKQAEAAWEIWNKTL